ncbi:M23 family metallopeptidase, partial [Akkermansiaceae bacterium]|nr:M23 family metallopeptidase [Akkermansiaceae bacterium]
PYPCQHHPMGRTIFCIIVLCLLAHQSGAASPQGFARLADGTVVEVLNKTQQQVTFKRANGGLGKIANDEVDGWLSARQADQLVDRFLPKAGIKEQHDEIRKQLKTLQMAAVPRIVYHLKTGDQRRRMEAIAALQFVWSTEAEAPVRAALNNEEQSIRSIALRLVQSRIPGDHTELLDTATEDEDPRVSGPALYTLLSPKPDSNRLAKALQNRELWPFLHTLLPRHHDRVKFGAITHRVLDTGNPDEQASALCSLIHQYDFDASTEKKILERLGDGSPAIRMRAAEYLRWHGAGSTLPSLHSALKAEQDLHCQAVIQAAVTAIEQRVRIFSRTLGTTTHDWSGDFATAGKTALRDWMSGPPTAALRFATLKLLGSRGSAPYVKYDGRNDMDADDADARYIELINYVAGYPGPVALLAAPRSASDTEPPAAATLVPPVRDYFDADRKSFGLFTGDYDGPFKDSHHVGDDVAFHQQHETVVAIGDGIVRHARIAAPSWGGIIIIEHHDPKTDKRFCSLYSHLGPLLCVKTGDKVRQGAMLGSLGRTFTLATGGDTRATSTSASISAPSAATGSPATFPRSASRSTTIPGPTLNRSSRNG